MGTAPERQTRSGLVYARMLVVTLCFLGLVTTGVPSAHASSPTANSADRLIIWTKCSELATLTDSELDMWKGRGVDGFVCMSRQLWGMGGTDDFTGAAGADLSANRYALQRSLRDSQIIARANARGMKAYLGSYLVNYYNTSTPLRDWFDDAGWSQVALPAVGNLAAAARRLGFAGIAFDQELYAQIRGVATATWNWNYPGNEHGEAAVRAKARQRGRELMTRIVDVFPGAELMAYGVELPHTWGELVQQKVNGDEQVFLKRLDIDFWDGLSSVEGYGSIRLADATFYKVPHFGTWDTALSYHYSSLFSFLSRRLSNWGYASKRLQVSPFAWIDRGPCGCAFEEPRPPEYVHAQLQAFRKWGMGGEFANYAFGGLRSFDYSPYAAAMTAASTPAAVDSQAPTLAVATASTAAADSAETTLRGTADDNLAVRAVRWSNDRGQHGMAELTWRITSGDHVRGYSGEMLWSIPDTPVHPGENTITVTAEDIKGLTRSSTVTIRGPGAESTPGAQPPPPAAGEEKPGAETAGEEKPGAKKLPRKAIARRCARVARSRGTRAKRRAAMRRCLRRARLRQR